MMQDRDLLKIGRWAEVFTQESIDSYRQQRGQMTVRDLTAMELVFKL